MYFLILVYLGYNGVSGLIPAMTTVPQPLNWQNCENAAADIRKRNSKVEAFCVKVKD